MINAALILASCALLFGFASFAATYSYGHFARRARGAPAHALPTEPAATLLDSAANTLTAGREGQNGLALLSDNLDAFAARAIAARSAGRSLDLMYYIWKNDLTGRLLAHEVVQAADRGVRVRILLDDINTRGLDGSYLALDSHPNIQIRLFNPSRAREDGLKRGAEMVLRAFSVTRRMHNKAWIADGRCAIIGGRNIGDEYFAAARASNFRDLDLLLLGPGVQQTETIFDAYWNSDFVIPIGALARWRRPRIKRFRRNLARIANGRQAEPYIAKLREHVSLSELIDLSDRLHWAETVEILSDPPEKAAGEKQANWLMARLLPLITEAERCVEITTPYFIPGDEGVRRLVELVERDVEVAVLTNSLAATDVAAAHGAYAQYRAALIAGGVRLYELQPYARKHEISAFGSSGASLHTKAFTVDGKRGFIGSLNFDPRSASVNTEMGVLFEQPELIARMRELFRLDTDPRASYGVSLQPGGGLSWRGLRNGRTQIYDNDPGASLARRTLAFLIGLMPIQSQL
ncbi:MAG: phospholipase D family protein [Bosea sp. (in: a-proteobacteria)]